MKVNEYNMIEELAVVLPPDTVVSLMKKIQKGDFVYYQIRTREFDAGRGAKFGYFLDKTGALLYNVRLLFETKGRALRQVLY